MADVRSEEATVLAYWRCQDTGVRAFVAVTDKDWYQFLAGRPELDEVNFWQPGGNRVFRALSPGEPLLFKLHYPDNAIVGGGFLAHASLIEASLAWDAFGEKNGAGSYAEMRRRIERYRRASTDPRASYQIGCIVLGTGSTRWQLRITRSSSGCASTEGNWRSNRATTCRQDLHAGEHVESLVDPRPEDPAWKAGEGERGDEDVGVEDNPHPRRRTPRIAF
jgi:hypothetical protein